MYNIAICDDDKNYREKIEKVIETEGILPKSEIRFYEYESGKELLKNADILHDLVFMDMRMPGLDGNKSVPVSYTHLDVYKRQELGVDHLYVDEAHSYKNAFLYTKMRNVAGIAQNEAQKSADMFNKCANRLIIHRSFLYVA